MRHIIYSKFSIITFFLLFCWGQVTLEAQVSNGIYNVKDFGAVGDGVYLDTKSIQEAIDICHKEGGGIVLLNQGTFVSGTLILKDNVLLQVEVGARLVGSKNLEDYPIMESKHPSYTGTFVTNKAFIYAEDAENIGIIGKGEINGSGDEWVDGPYGFPSFSVRPRIIHFRGCENILVRDITLKNSASWVQSYQSSKNIVIDAITVDSRENKDIELARYAHVPGRNTDGLDLVDCQYVRISNSFINSGDDAICIKSFSPEEGSRNITVTNCVVTSNASGIKIGTESAGAFEDITVQNCTVYDTRVDAISMMSVDGAKMERIIFSNITVRNIKGAAIFVRLGNRGNTFRKDIVPNKGSVKDILITNILGTGISQYGCSITGIPGMPIENITLQNISLEFDGGSKQMGIDKNLTLEEEIPFPQLLEEMEREIPENEKNYPRGEMFGRLPAYGFFVRHVKTIQMDNIRLGFKKVDHRYSVVFDDVTNLEVRGLRSQGTELTPAQIKLSDVTNAIISDSGPTSPVQNFIGIYGQSDDVILLHNRINGIRKDVLTGDPNVTSKVKVIEL
jgi:hypothetical protein